MDAMPTREQVADEISLTIDEVPPQQARQIADRILALFAPALDAAVKAEKETFEMSVLVERLVDYIHSYVDHGSHGEHEPAWIDQARDAAIRARGER